jgi:hypothetical protein
MLVWRTSISLSPVVVAMLPRPILVTEPPSGLTENTINTHKYNTIYSSLTKSYYKLAPRISYIEEF